MQIQGYLVTADTFSVSHISLLEEYNIYMLNKIQTVMFVQGNGIQPQSEKA